MPDRLKLWCRRRGDTLLAALRKVRRFMAVSRANSWRRLYWAQYNLARWRAAYGVRIAIAVMLLLAGLGAYSTTFLQNLLAPYFANQTNVSALQSLLLAIGSALVGAAAIVFSFVMFAMQVNVERMPHGLFRRFSSDLRLLAAFGVAFFLSLGVACVSVISSQSWIVVGLIFSSWSIAAILLLFVYSYRRALVLINPAKQLALVVYETRRELRIWSRRAERARPLLESPTDENTIVLASPK